MCVNCNEKITHKIYEIKDRGHGSSFDLDEIQIPLCDDCIKTLKIKDEWFENKHDENGFYEYESDLENLINEIGINKVILTNICSSSIITLQ